MWLTFAACIIFLLDSTNGVHSKPAKNVKCSAIMLGCFSLSYKQKILIYIPLYGPVVTLSTLKKNHHVIINYSGGESFILGRIVLNFAQ